MDQVLPAVELILVIYLLIQDFYSDISMTLCDSSNQCNIVYHEINQITDHPTRSPTNLPTLPSLFPTRNPSVSPTIAPILNSTQTPTLSPTNTPYRFINVVLLQNVPQLAVQIMYYI